MNGLAVDRLAKEFLVRNNNILQMGSSSNHNQYVNFISKKWWYHYYQVLNWFQPLARCLSIKTKFERVTENKLSVCHKIWMRWPVTVHICSKINKTLTHSMTYSFRDSWSQINIGTDLHTLLWYNWTAVTNTGSLIGSYDQMVIDRILGK